MDPQKIIHLGKNKWTFGDVYRVYNFEQKKSICALCSLSWSFMCWASLIRKPENWNTTKPKPLEYPVDRSMCSLMLQCKWTPTMKSLTTLHREEDPSPQLMYHSEDLSLQEYSKWLSRWHVLNVYSHDITCEAKANIHCSMKIWFVCFGVVVCVYACARAQTHTEVFLFSAL